VDPRAEYGARLAARRAEEARLSARDRAFSFSRLAVAAAFALILWLALGPAVLPIWAVLFPAAAFAVLATLHDRVIRGRRRAGRAAGYFERAIERLDGKWAGRGETGERFIDDSHPYAADLDLFGKGSLFELTCSARTRAGEAALARWLLSPASIEEVRARQEAVEELRGAIDLREELGLLGEAVRAGVHPDELSAWGSAPPILHARAERWTAGAASAMSVMALSAWGLGASGAFALAALAVQLAVAMRLRPRVTRVIADVETPGKDLALLSQVLERLERERFVSPRLAALRSALDADGGPPSRRIARLRRLLELLDSKRNQLFAPIAALLMWTTQIAFALERWRAASGPAVSRWLEAVGEMEALCALSGYAFEHPGHPFPEILPSGGHFHAEGIGHPLLPPEKRVTNDVRLGGGETSLLVVSGSNMSGKSTLLRTVGTNAVLAMAGSPVCARRLRIAPLAIGASIRIADSLQGGTSRFYTEIKRLRKIVDLTRGDRPVLFLLDEILHGTNSHDRRIGAEAVVRGLVDRGAVGLVTTHDLALSQIAESLGEGAANVHFEDHLEDGRMVFDYRMRPGVVRKSNAIELMRAVGLEV
jgi:hypothetical protein